MLEEFNRSSVEYTLVPLSTRGGGWGSREETRCEIERESFTFIAYYDDLRRFAAGRASCCARCTMLALMRWSELLLAAWLPRHLASFVEASESIAATP